MANCDLVKVAAGKAHRHQPTSLLAALANVVQMIIGCLGRGGTSGLVGDLTEDKARCPSISRATALGRCHRRVYAFLDVQHADKKLLSGCLRCILSLT